MSGSTSEEVLRILHEVGAVITGDHIVYTSGKHGTAYVNKDAVYVRPRCPEWLCGHIAANFANDNVQVVCGPAIGGVVLSQWTAYALSSGKDVLAVYSEKSEAGDTFVIRRGYNKLITGRRVLVVEDVLTTGGSARKVVEAVRAVGGEVVGLGALCNRGGVTAADLADVPKLFTLANVTLDAWDEADCPLCKQGIPINVEVGKGLEFLARKKNQ